MKKFLTLIIIPFFLVGCSTASSTSPITIQGENLEKVKVKKEHAPSLNISSELENIKEEALEEIVEVKGIVFGKTDFQGVLKTRYVRIMIESQEDEARKFQLHIGEKIDQQTFPWEVKRVEPGYFFIELPVGKYRMTSISIPVGTSSAVEDIDVRFEVLDETVVYLGTLQVNGTKERIKLGGVPVIKPGFEYTINVIDQKDEGIQEFHQRYADVATKIKTAIMQVHAQESQPQQ